MRRSHLGLFSLIALVFCFAPSGWAEEPKASALDVLAPYVGGTWKTSSSWSDGNALDAFEQFEWGVGKKFIVCKTYVNTPKGYYQRYETVFGEQDGKLMAWGFTFDGSFDASHFKVDGKKLSSEKVMAGDPSKTSTLHQSIELVEPDKFRWLVSIEKDGQDKQIMDGVWIRSKESENFHPTIVWPKVEPSADSAVLDYASSLIGTWKIKSKWSDGRDINAQSVYDWGVGKKFVACKTTLFKPDGSVDYDRYYTLYGVADGKLMAYQFMYNGTTDFAPMRVEGKQMSCVRTFKNPEGDLVVNQFVERVAPDRLRWKVWTDKDGADKPMIDDAWIRKENN